MNLYTHTYTKPSRNNSIQQILEDLKTGETSTYEAKRLINGLMHEDLFSPLFLRSKKCEQ